MNDHLVVRVIIEGHQEPDHRYLYEEVTEHLRELLDLVRADTNLSKHDLTSLITKNSEGMMSLLSRGLTAHAEHLGWSGRLEVKKAETTILYEQGRVAYWFLVMVSPDFKPKTPGERLIELLGKVFPEQVEEVEQVEETPPRSAKEILEKLKGQANLPLSQKLSVDKILRKLRERTRE